MTRAQLQGLARHGAQLRLAELQAEQAELLAQFPDLATAPTPRRRGRPARRFTAGGESAPATAQDTATVADAEPRRGRRRRMTAAQRKAVSERMTKMWAQLRKQRGK